MSFKDIDASIFDWVTYFAWGNPRFLEYVHVKDLAQWDLLVRWAIHHPDLAKMVKFLSVRLNQRWVTDIGLFELFMSTDHCHNLAFHHLTPGPSIEIFPCAIVMVYK